ncbi:MAG: hypothetical protein ABS69_00300 [Nitrosomonadales bacterium SCN 54-20]|jgi:hypothetical protein|nr:MAG: hypothetical protein ABS69_00300 [Nitrosomonadales bacterium SCN 54-20]
MKTVSAIPKMDCLAEERLAHMVLNRQKAFSRLDCDLSAWQLTVLHNTASKKILAWLSPLGPGAYRHKLSVITCLEE